MRSRPFAVVLALVVAASPAAAGCSDDDEPRAGSTTTIADPVSTTDPSTTTPSTSGPAGPCPTAADPTGVVQDVPLPLDADGDGVEDEIALTLVDDTTVEVVVDYGAGGRSVEVYDDPSIGTFAPLRVDRVGDVDDDGDDDAWLVVAAGASTEVVSLVVADGCTVRRPEVDGQPNAFPVGASVGASSGIECLPGGFVQHEGSSVDGTTYEGTSTRWLVDDDGDLERAGSMPFVVDTTAGDASAYAGLAC